jgi:hypothetical protein
MMQKLANRTEVHAILLAFLCVSSSSLFAPSQLTVSSLHFSFPIQFTNWKLEQ